MAGQTGQPEHCMMLVRLLDKGLDNVHRFCPEEQKWIIKKAVHAAEVFFQTIMGHCNKIDIE